MEEKKIEALEIRLKNWFLNITDEKILVALSGGVDSSLVCYLSRVFLGKKRVVAAISDSPSLKRADLKAAIDFCTKFDISYKIIHAEEYLNTDYLKNPSNRCFFCKTSLYKAMLDFAKQESFSLLLNGQNKSDYSDYRPGIKAAEDYSVLAPLAINNVIKEDVRNLALKYDLPCWNKPASPCLSSRVPYQSKITISKLAQIEKAESYLHQLGFCDVRVRHYGSNAKIEVPFEEIPALSRYEDRVESFFKTIGFSSISIDLEGLVSGKLNRDLNLDVKSL